jgi:hypothetical protein
MIHVRGFGLKAVIWLVVVASFAAILAMAACAPRTAGTNTGADIDGDGQAGQQVLMSWSPDSECSVCHMDEAASMIDERLASAHAGVNNCVSCHDDEDALTQVHVDTANADVPRKLSVTKVDPTLCGTCHKPDVIAAETIGILVDKEESTFNPHDLPATEDHAGITCTNCHRMHDEDDALTLTSRTCRTCHHADIYKPCIQCHSE